MSHGRIIRNTGSNYIVCTDDGRSVECKVKGNFRLRGIRSTNPVAVGDFVSIREGGDVAYITEIDERKNYIIRRASNLSKQSHILAANLDLAVLVVTIARPATTTTFIDRFLATAEAYRVPALIVFNKVDDLNEEEREQMEYWTAVYDAIGYPCIALSALQAAEQPEALAPLLAHLQGKTSLLAGHSGVGKSTLLNALVPNAKVRTAEVSDAYGTGVHTTTFSELFPLPGGGSVIDIPGVKGFGTFNFEPEEVAHFFRDIFAISADCRFNNCMHINEPGCAVLAALENYHLAPSRYASYLSMLEDKEEGKYRAGIGKQ